MKISATRLVFIILIVCGIIFSSILLIPRIIAELNDRSVATAIPESELEVLASDSGMSEEQWLSQAGIDFVVVSPGIGMDAVGTARFTLPGTDADLPLALVENIERSSVLLPEGYELGPGPHVKTLELFPEYAGRELQEIENLLYRAALDRGQRLLLLHPFGEESDPEVYAGVLDSLASRLQKRGIAMDGEFSCLNTVPLSPLLLAGAGLLSMTLWVNLICRWGKLKKAELPLYILGTVGVLVAGIALPELTQKILMLACAAVFPCYSILGIKKFLRIEKPSAAKYLLGLCALGLWSLLGGLAVSTLMASADYMLGREIFSGVKLSQAVPLASCLVVFAIPVYKAVRERGIDRRSITALAITAVVLVAATALLTLRSGDLKGGISALETAFRNGLEYVLYARPRTKEILVAVPFAALLCFKHAKKIPLLALLGAMAACLECVSVVNTFCHAVAPVYVSVLRSLLGLGIGAVLGLMLLGIEWLTAKLHN